MLRSKRYTAFRISPHHPLSQGTTHQSTICGPQHRRLEMLHVPATAQHVVIEIYISDVDFINKIECSVADGSGVARPSIGFVCMQNPTPRVFFN